MYITQAVDARIQVIVQLCKVVKTLATKSNFFGQSLQRSHDFIEQTLIRCDRSGTLLLHCCWWHLGMSPAPDTHAQHTPIDIRNQLLMAPEIAHWPLATSNPCTAKKEMMVA